MLFRRISSPMALLCALSTAPQPAVAEAVVASPGPLQEQLATLATGDQLLVQGRSGVIRFAGREVSLANATAIIGYASEVAYLAVIEGSATGGELTADRGKMLMIPPFGSDPGVERFDARRLADALSEHGTVNGTPAFALLEELADGQDRGVFLGRLARTSFNLTTLGSAREEMDRRGRVGGTQIRQVRFDTPDPGGDVEQAIVERFLQALAMADTATVAQMLDPLPYGYGNMANAAGQARMLMAEVLVAERDWRAFAAASLTRSGEASWVASRGGQQATIDLRRTTEFAFVESIEVEG